MRNGLIPAVCAALLWLLCGPLFAQGKKPQNKNAPKSESHPLHDAKEGANTALEGLDQGIHQAGSTLKNGANQALEAVDQGVHKIIGSKKD